MVKDNIIRARIPNKSTYSLEDLDRKAEDMGMSRSQFVLRAVEMLLHFDKSFLDIIDQYKRLGLPEYLVIQNLIITAEAERAARDEACGKERRIYTEFAMTDDGYLTGAELFAEMKQKAIRKAKFKEATHD